MKNGAVPAPEAGSYWRAADSTVYKVLLIANSHTRLRHYPVSVVFMSAGGKVWCVQISKWCKLVRSGAFTSAPDACIVEGDASGIPG